MFSLQPATRSNAKFVFKNALNMRTNRPNTLAYAVREQFGKSVQNIRQTIPFLNQI